MDGLIANCSPTSKGRNVRMYVFFCGACGRLAASGEKDKTTCSPACNVRLHLHPELAGEWHLLAKRSGNSLGFVCAAYARDFLMPGINDSFIREEITGREMCRQTFHAFTELLFWNRRGNFEMKPQYTPKKIP